jgi:hypothetical protein
MSSPVSYSCKENPVLSLVYRHLSRCLAQWCKIYYSEWGATVVRVEEAERIRVHLLSIDLVEDDIIRTNFWLWQVHYVPSCSYRLCLPLQ